MKRKRGRKPAGKKAAPAAEAAAESTSPDSPSSPSTEATNSTPDQAEEDNAPPVAQEAGVAAPGPPPPPAPPSESQPPQKPPVDITYTKPKVGAVYGRVKLKFKSSKAVDPPPPPPPPPQASSEAQAPAADAGKSESATAPEVIKGAVAEKAAVLTDGQQTDGQASEPSDADKEKVARKVGGIKIKSAGLSSVGNNTPDRKAESVDESPLSKQEAVLEIKEIEETVELRSSQEPEEKQSTPERQRDDKELAAALEVSYIENLFALVSQAIEKVMKMDAAEPFNIPVDPVALGIPVATTTPVMRMPKATQKASLRTKGVAQVIPLHWNFPNGVPFEKVQWNDRHKSDCICAVCQVTRRKKERDEILAVVDNETAAMDSNTSDQHDMEGNSGANNPGSHDTSSSQEQPPETDVYKETTEADDSGIRMEGVGKFSSDRPSNLPHPDYEDEGSRQSFGGKQQVEYRDMNSNEEHTPTQPNEYSDVEHNQQKVTVARLPGQPQHFVAMYILPLFDNMLGLIEPKEKAKLTFSVMSSQAQMETSQEVEMEEDYPMQQENPSFLQLCASLFPCNQRPTFRVRHSLFRPRRRAPLKESPLHVAIAGMMKR
ncbi:hypothetical protein BAE44_0007468 [Dichanthelium oligosanthes]|uniref:Uncharacterized protein n=1 Tax=Dichanthelium oligosanthes TaxID=888268 RepID=A0A1E5W2D8_9POAL|nr:hypothetical protein BAE44_0007468 [Dichanthelium oligosanthes]